MNALGTTMTTLAAAPFWTFGRELWFGDQASTMAPKTDSLFMFIFWISTIFFVGIVGALMIFVIKYRKREGAPHSRSVAHNTPLELTWTFLPLILLVVMFVWGFRDYMYLQVAPAGAEEIEFKAQQWSWQATYDNGANPQETMLVNTKEVPVIPVPADRPIKVLLHSVDVLHAFFIPDFRLKIDVVPDRYTTLWFQATSEAPTQYDDNGKPLPYTDHYLFCAEYCGDAHSQMAAIIRVMPASDYEVKKAAMADIRGGKTPAEIGAVLYNVHGCVACHNTDSSRSTGPGWGGIWGKTEHVALPDGSSAEVTVDENYVRESILVPSAKIVDGFANQMTPYQGQLKDWELEALIAYIKSLGD